MITVEPVDVMILANVVSLAFMFVQDAKRKRLEEQVKTLVSHDWNHFRALRKLETSLDVELFERKDKPKQAVSQG